MAQDRQFRLTRWGSGEEQVHPMLYQTLAQSRHQFPDIGIDEIGPAHGQHQPDEAAAARHQLARSDIGHIAIFAGGLRHTLARLEGNLGIVGQRARHSGDRHVEVLCQLLECLSLCRQCQIPPISNCKRLHNEYKRLQFLDHGVTGVKHAMHGCHAIVSAGGSGRR